MTGTTGKTKRRAEGEQDGDRDAHARPNKRDRAKSLKRQAEARDALLQLGRKDRDRELAVDRLVLEAKTNADGGTTITESNRARARTLGWRGAWIEHEANTWANYVALPRKETHPDRALDVLLMLSLLYDLIEAAEVTDHTTPCRNHGQQVEGSTRESEKPAPCQFLADIRTDAPMQAATIAYQHLKSGISLVQIERMRGPATVSTEGTAAALADICGAMHAPEVLRGRSASAALKSHAPRDAKQPDSEPDRRGSRAAAAAEVLSRLDLQLKVKARTFENRLRSLHKQASTYKAEILQRLEAAHLREDASP